MKRLLVVNPNANVQVTAWLGEAARRAAGPEVAVEAVNAQSGLAALETPEHVRIAADAVLRAVEAARADAAVIGAFGDPGLELVRAAGFAAAGLGEAGLRAAAARRFGIVTLGAAMREPIAARVAALGWTDRLVALQILSGRVSDYVAAREARRDEVAGAIAACVAAGAENVLLGGAPFAGQAEDFSSPGALVIDGVANAVAAALTGD